MIQFLLQNTGHLLKFGSAFLSLSRTHKCLLMVVKLVMSFKVFVEV